MHFPCSRGQRPWQLCRHHRPQRGRLQSVSAIPISHPARAHWPNAPFAVNFSIEQREVGAGRPALVVAEVAQAHDGSLGTAHAYIDAAAGAGADAVKFQTHIASAESTPGEPFRVKFSPQDATRYDYWKRMEFSRDGWRGLADHARQAGLIFLSTPFSFEAVELLDDLGMPAWKVGSGEVTNLPMLERMARTRRPVIVSSGMADFAELDRAVACVRACRGAGRGAAMHDGLPLPSGKNRLEPDRRAAQAV